jgi:hypothetical protein
MRYYFPEKPYFRWFRQKQDCSKLQLPSALSISKAAPKPKALAKVAAADAQQPKPAAIPNARAHAFLDQVAAMHKWLTVSPPPKQRPPDPVASAPTSNGGKPHKPIDPFDLQDVPASLDAHAFKLAADLMRQWFANPAYTVQSQSQKDCLSGAPSYPPELVKAHLLQHKDLIRVEHVKQAYEKIKTQEFLTSKAARDALTKILRKTPAGTVDIDASQEFGEDLQKMHRKYAFAAITVGQQFPENFNDIRIEPLDKSKEVVADLELALGAFRWYAAINRAHVFYNGRTTRRIQVQSVAIYAMAPYGFDDFEQTLEYHGHFNKKHMALVTAGTWVNYPVYTGSDMHANNAILWPVFKQDFRQWREKHKQGGDMLLFSERMEPRNEPIDVVVPLEPSPGGTIYWGGAGLDGPYIRLTLDAFRNAGISNLYVGMTNTASQKFGQVGTIIDAMRAGLLVRYEDVDDWKLTSGMNASEGQFNLIGYSYGSLLAAQTANYYAKNGHSIDHLVLIGSPIDEGFLGKLRASPNIKRVVVINLTAEGDEIYAGMSQALMMNPLFMGKLAKDMFAGKGEGHFYYGHVVPDIEARLKELADYIVSKGLR